MRDNRRQHLYESIGLRIRELRKKNGFSQDQLGKTLGLTRTSIVNIEKGRQQISIHNLVILCQVYNTSIEYFFEEINLNPVSEKKEIKLLEKEINLSRSNEASSEKIAEFLKNRITKGKQQP